MLLQRNYLDDAKKYEEVFRNILRSLDKEELDLELQLEEIYKKYSTGNRYGIWTILDFRKGPFDSLSVKFSENEVLFASQNIAFLSGHGRIDKYRVKENNSVEFDSNISFWVS